MQTHQISAILSATTFPSTQVSRCSVDIEIRMIVQQDGTQSIKTEINDEVGKALNWLSEDVTWYLMIGHRGHEIPLTWSSLHTANGDLDLDYVGVEQFLWEALAKEEKEQREEGYGCE